MPPRAAARLPAAKLFQRVRRQKLSLCNSLAGHRTAALMLSLSKHAPAYAHRSFRLERPSTGSGRGPQTAWGRLSGPGQGIESQAQGNETPAQGNETPTQGNESPAQGNESIDARYFNSLGQSLAPGAPLTLTFCGSRSLEGAPSGHEDTIPQNSGLRKKLSTRLSTAEYPRLRALESGPNQPDRFRRIAGIADLDHERRKSAGMRTFPVGPVSA